MTFSATILLLLLPAVLCDTYLESLNGLLMSTEDTDTWKAELADGKFKYEVVFGFRDDTAPELDVCDHQVTASPLCLIVNSNQAANEVAIPRGRFHVVNPELGTTVYRVEPELFIRQRCSDLSSNQGFHHGFRRGCNFEAVNDDDRFCLFMLDAGVEGDSLMTENKPFIHWALCDKEGTLTEMIEYMKVPALGVETKTIVFVLLKQPAEGTDILTIDPSYLDTTCEGDFEGRCQFDIAEFMTANELTVAYVMNAKAVPDVVGLDVANDLLGDSVCDFYDDVTAITTTIEDGSLPEGMILTCEEIMSRVEQRMGRTCN